MLKKSFLALVLIGTFFSGLAFPVYAADLPLLMDCSELHSTDMSLQSIHEVDSKISGVTASDDNMLLWTTRGNASGGWTRNENVWTNNGDVHLDFTGASVRNNNIYYTGGGTLVTPRHMVLVNHTHIPTGTVFTFIDSSGNIVNRTITAQVQVPGQDIIVALLDSDVPAGITYYPMIDSDTLKNYWKNVIGSPFVILDQDDRVFIRDVANQGVQSGNIYHQRSASPLRDSFSKDFKMGDSGNPLFLLVGGRLVFVAMIYTYDFSLFLPQKVAGIKEAVTSLGGGYQVSGLNLSCFNSQPTPSFEEESKTFSIDENTSNGTVVGSVPATGGDISYAFTSGNTSNAFAVSNSGEITVNNSSSLNFETQNSYATTLKASSSGWYWPKEDTITATINLNDLNESPVFSASSYIWSVSEELSSGSPIGTVTATDPDSTSENVSYSIVSGNSGDVFSISPTTGQISLKAGSSLDIDVEDSYDLLIKAEDSNDIPASSTVHAHINVTGNNRPSIRFKEAGSTYFKNVGTVSLQVLLSSAYTKDISFSIRASGGNAVEGQDYTLNSSTILIPAGNTSAVLSINLMNNQNVSENKSLNLEINSATKASIISPSSHFLIIKNVPQVSSGGGGGGGKKLKSSSPAINSAPEGCASGFKFSPLSGAPCKTEKTPLTNSLSGFTFKNVLRPGISHPDVKKLQQFLNQKGYVIASFGPGSINNETNYFGPATRMALIRFQKDNKIFPQSGTMGPITMNIINKLISSY